MVAAALAVLVARVQLLLGALSAPRQVLSKFLLGGKITEAAQARPKSHAVVDGANVCLQVAAAAEVDVAVHALEAQPLAVCCLLASLVGLGAAKVAYKLGPVRRPSGQGAAAMEPAAAVSAL